MAPKQKPTVDTTADLKKRRRVGFSAVDSGIEANECIKIYLVSSKEEVGCADSFCITPVDLNGFFEEDGKIYGYHDLKISIWVSLVSFHAYADITYQSKADGGKGISDLKSSLQRIFAETLVEEKDDFLQTFSADCGLIRSIVSEGELLQQKASNGHTGDSMGNLEAATSDVEVVRMVIGNPAAGHFYSRLIPLVLLLIDGSNPIDVSDPQWELYVAIQKKNDEQGGINNKLLGFSAVYRFFHYPGSTRLRLSQILVLPPYQHKGYGLHLVETINTVAISEDVYDLTVEEPLDYFQHVRTCVDIQRLLVFEPIQDAVNSAVARFKHGKLSKKTHVPRFIPPASAVDNVRKVLKINKKQFLQCWEVLIYLGLDPIEKYIDDFKIVVSNRMKIDILGKDSVSGGKQVIEVPSNYNPEMSFVMCRSRSQGGEAITVRMDENQTNQEEQMQQLVDERLEVIKRIAKKVHRA